MPCTDRPELDAPAYEFIDTYWKEHSVPPNIIEVRNALKLNGTVLVLCVLERLKEAGKLVKAVPPTPAWVQEALDECADD